MIPPPQRLTAKAEQQLLPVELQTLRQEKQNLLDELNVANEERITYRELMQSALDLMQSSNQELHLKNAELQASLNDQLSLNHDLQTQLNCTELASIFLDNFLILRGFTKSAPQLFKLRASDLGRPLFDINTTLIYPELKIDIQSVIDSLVIVEKQVRTSGDQCVGVHIAPYSNHRNKLYGVAITFFNCSNCSFAPPANFPRSFIVDPHFYYVQTSP